MAGDDVDEFRAVLRAHAVDADLIITTGGVSAGAYEVVKDAFGERGVEFVKVAMQPGMPQGAGVVDGGAPVVTLPGNPVSALVSFEVFVRAALRAAMGLRTPSAQAHGPLTEALTSPRGKRQFRRGYYTPQEGQVTGIVGPKGGPGSHLLASFAQANCRIELGEGVTEAKKDSIVDVLLL